MPTTPVSTDTSITLGNYEIRSVPLKTFLVWDAKQEVAFGLPMGGVIPFGDDAYVQALNEGGQFQAKWRFIPQPSAADGTQVFKIQNKATGQLLFCNSSGIVCLFGTTDGELGIFDNDYALWTAERYDGTKPTIGLYSKSDYTSYVWMMLKNQGSKQYVKVVTAGPQVMLACVDAPNMTKAGLIDLFFMFRFRRGNPEDFQDMTIDMSGMTRGTPISVVPMDFSNPAATPMTQSAKHDWKSEDNLSWSWSKSATIETSYTKTASTTQGGANGGPTSTRGSSETNSFSFTMTVGQSGSKTLTTSLTWEPNAVVDPKSRFEGTATLSKASGSLAFAARFTDEDGSWTQHGTISAEGLAHYFDVTGKMTPLPATPATV